MHLSYSVARSLYSVYNYPFLERPYHLNLSAIRAKPILVDEFNDVVFGAYKDAYGLGHCLSFKGTTDPGLYWLKNKMGNINGTFILAPGFYEDCLELGYHRGRYRAFVQKGYGIFRGWRDNDSDGKVDMSGPPLYTDVTGLNLHHADDADYVGPYSAACMVIQNDKEHRVVVSLGERHAELHGDKFNFALFQA